MKKFIVVILSLYFLVMLSGYQNQALAQTMTKEEITVTNEVTKIGSYSQMLRAGNLVFCSGQVAFDPATGKITGEDITAQTKQALDNLESELKDAGLTINDAVKVTVYLKDMKDFAAMDAEYGKHFTKPYPVRSCIQAAELPVEGALILIDMTCLDPNAK